MKKFLFTLSIIFAVTFTAFSQSTTITPGSVLPQMTTAQRTAVSNPVNGMLVYDTNTNSYWFYQTNTWVQLANGGGSGFWQLNGLNGDEIKNTNSGGFWSANPTALPSDALDATNPPTAPINNNGTRLMWVSSRSAFRVGSVGDGSKAWDADSIGLFSFASGYNSKAKGKFSTALGDGTSASGFVATAIGRETVASGSIAIAMGSLTEASGTYSIAIGFRTKASGLSSTAMGNNSLASGEYATAAGFNAFAGGQSAVALGHSSFARSDYSVAMGFNTSARGEAANAMGYQTEAVGDYSTAIGYQTEAAGNYSTAMGNSTKALGFASTAIGDLTTASGSGSTAMGQFTIASGNASTAMGSQTVASGGGSTAMGIQTVASGGRSTAMGEGSAASATNSTAFGIRSVASGFGSTALGIETVASGVYATAMGDATVAKARAATSIGKRNNNSDNPTGIEQGSDRLFQIGNGTSSTRSNAMTVLRNGYIGTMNNVDPQANLHLKYAGFTNWDAHLRLEAANNEYANIVCDEQGLKFRAWGSGDDFFFRNSTNTSTATIFSTGNMTIAGDLTQDSDRRLKNNIVGITNSSQKLNKLNGYNYNWKAADRDPNLQTGLIAQEVQALFPELVSEGEDGYLSVNYIGLIPHLIEAVKDLQKDKEKLTKTVEKLTAENQTSKATAENYATRMAAIEAKLNLLLNENTISTKTSDEE